MSASVFGDSSFLLPFFQVGSIENRLGNFLQCFLLSAREENLYVDHEDSGGTPDQPQEYIQHLN